jgi:phosphoglycerol transferase
VTSPLGPKSRSALAYAAAAALSLYAAIVMFNYWRADFRVPFEYAGDATFHGFLVKSVVDHGWYLTNPDVGAPGGLQLHDFPVLDNFHLLTVKVMSLFSGDWALIFNLYFLMGFPLITLAALAALRQFGVAWGPAIVASVLYAFLPSRLIKGQGHLFLDVFYQVPLAMMVALWVCGDDPPLAHDRPGRRLPVLELRRARTWASLLICLLSASMSAYYSFFTALLLAAGGVWASLDRRSLSNAVAGLALAGAIVVGLGANNLPTTIYRAQHGTDKIVGLRGSGEAEIYGMKIAQLVLPVDGHRVHKLAHLRERYNVNSPLLTENTQASLGIVGTIGFLLLIALLFVVPRPGSPRADLLRPLSVLNGVALLIATLGGFGSLFALIVSPQIRTYTRMNVLIGFLTLFAAALLLERLQRRWPAIGRAALPVVLLIGLLDQVAPNMIRDYAASKRLFDADRDLVHRIEAAVPAKAVILQLPYMYFPESPMQVRMNSYDHLMPYLHSHTVRWTFGAMHDRPGDLWLRDLSKQPAPALIAALRAVGGGGVLVDRWGYEDEGRAVEADLRAALGGADPIVSDGGRRAFYRLSSPAAR